jgi:cell division protein FtsZ
LVQRANPASMRLAHEPAQPGETRSLQTRAQQAARIRSDEQSAPVDDQLDIPAFLRRQVN